MKQLSRDALLAITVVTLASPKPAAAIDYVFNSGDGSIATITKTVDGVTLTVNNMSPNPFFFADGAGLALGNNGIANVTQFDLSFDAPVTLISYEVGFVNPGVDGDEFLNIASTSGSSNNNPLDTLGTFNFTNQYNLGAGEVATVNIAGVDNFNDLSQLQTLTVVLVPFELEATFGLVAIGGLFGCYVFNKKRKTNRKLVA